MATRQRQSFVQQFGESARIGVQGVWKLIYWNILAIAARLVAAVWLLVSAWAYLAGTELNTAVGALAGAVVFVGLPVAYGAVVRYRQD